MNVLEEQLREYGKTYSIRDCQEEKVLGTIGASREAFYESEAAKTLIWREFFFQQAAYIKKRWWVLQFLILAGLWLVLYASGGSVYAQREMGMLASLFVILVIPELWKNRSSGSLEVEGTAYYSLRQIYAARLLLFAAVDILFLSVFCVMVSVTLQVTLRELIMQFFLPMNITCCICFRTLGSKRFGTEAYAVMFCLVWAAIWALLILKRGIYDRIAGPVWAVVVAVSFVYLCVSVYRFLTRCGSDWEVDLNWN